jgi:hypothetical protein
MNEATQQQATPKGTGPDITPLVIADLQARSAEGVKKYGEPLRAFNGRRALVDAYQEVLDLAQYLRQELEETRTAAAPAPDVKLGARSLKYIRDWIEQLGDGPKAPILELVRHYEMTAALPVSPRPDLEAQENPLAAKLQEANHRMVICEGVIREAQAVLGKAGLLTPNDRPGHGCTCGFIQQFVVLREAAPASPRAPAPQPMDEEEGRIRRHYTTSSDWSWIEHLLGVIDKLRSAL